jgi:hypothetical protein
LPCLIQAPRDHERARRRQVPRRPYEVLDEVLGSPYIFRQPISLELDFDEDYRSEIAKAFAELYLLHEHGPVLSIMEHRPLRDYIDPAKFLTAREACNGQNPINDHLNPLLVALGHPPL